MNKNYEDSLYKYPCKLNVTKKDIDKYNLTYPNIQYAPQRGDIGWIYKFIYMKGSLILYKIGHSIDPWNRFNHFKNVVKKQGGDLYISDSCFIPTNKHLLSFEKEIFKRLNAYDLWIDPSNPPDFMRIEEVPSFSPTGHKSQELFKVNPQTDILFNHFLEREKAIFNAKDRKMWEIVCTRRAEKATWTNPSFDDYGERWESFKIKDYYPIEFVQLDLFM